MTTMRMTVKALSLLAALLLSACSRQEAASASAERSGRLYQAAMADYAAGRLDAAMAGLEKVVRAQPGNASARFQLATLLQDRRQDHLSALSLYREYLLQSPSSDKAALARERAALCERQYALALMRKHAGTNTAVYAEIAKLKTDLAARTAELGNVKAALGKMTEERDVQKRENERLRRMVSSIGTGESTARPAVVTAKDLLDDDEEEQPDRVKMSADIKNLIAEEKEETTASPLPVVAKKKPAVAPKKDEPLHEDRPDTYVVEEGDTLYKIAIRFYGRRSAWRKIRDANKTVISVDGRVNAGETIRLP